MRSDLFLECLGNLWSFPPYLALTGAFWFFLRFLSELGSGVKKSGLGQGASQEYLVMGAGIGWIGLTVELPHANWPFALGCHHSAPGNFFTHIVQWQNTDIFQLIETKKLNINNSLQLDMEL